MVVHRMDWFGLPSLRDVRFDGVLRLSKMRTLRVLFFWSCKLFLILCCCLSICRRVWVHRRDVQRRAGGRADDCGRRLPSAIWDCKTHSELWGGAQGAPYCVCGHAHEASEHPGAHVRGCEILFETERHVPAAMAHAWLHERQVALQFRAQNQPGRDHGCTNFQRPMQLTPARQEICLRGRANYWGQALRWPTPAHQSFPHCRSERVRRPSPRAKLSRQPPAPNCPLRCWSEKERLFLILQRILFLSACGAGWSTHQPTSQPSEKNQKEFW